MSDENEELEHERVQQSARIAQLSQLVIPLLRQLAPEASDEALVKACQEVGFAIIRYERSLQPVKGETLAEKRRDLARLKKTFQKCLKLIDPSQSTNGALLNVRLAQLHHSGASLKHLRYQLHSATFAVDSCLEQFEARPSHSADPDTANLAASLRWTLVQTLGVHPVMTPDSVLSSVDHRATANYARLLRLALTLAGQKPPDDLQHMMERGHELLRERGEPVVDHMVSADYPEGVSVLRYGKFDTKK